MRVAFSIFGGTEWTGGINYLTNLLSAIAEHPEQKIEAVLFVSNDVDDNNVKRLIPYLSASPVKSEIFNSKSNTNYLKKLRNLIAQKNHDVEYIFKKHNIDVVFQHACWYGARFDLPTLVWIGDFQHKILPTMFSRYGYWKREIGFQLLTRFGTVIMTSSNVGINECHRFYPHTIGKAMSLPFVVRPPQSFCERQVETIKDKYSLSERFFYLPSQFWKHKNHLSIIKAVQYLADSGKEINVVMSGKMSDLRNHDYPEFVKQNICECGLEKRIRILGMIPYDDIYRLMKSSIGVINPSFYEGWSTTVEEAKSIGVPLLLSDIPVHREQACPSTRFFNAENTKNIADVLWRAWCENDIHNHITNEQAALKRIDTKRKEFVDGFNYIASETLTRFINSKLD